MASQASSGTQNLQNFGRWLAARPYLALTLAVLVILVPFLSKPFNVDDPLFLWAAHQIQSHPADPYGFQVNWYGRWDPMSDVTKNPPLACYYLAAAAAVLHWSECALHFAFLLPALAAILGTYRLASHFCAHPLLAGALTLLTPVFLVSSSTVMCDTLMLAFWMWAAVLWVEGLERDNLARLAEAGVLIALATLTKYYGACLIPLLAAYGLLTKRHMGRWLLALVIPIVALVAYQFIMYRLYGHGLLADASDYVAVTKATQGAYERVWSGLTALTFTGGCLAAATFLMPCLWRPRQWLALAAMAAAILLVLRWERPVVNGYGDFAGSSRRFVELQILVWAVGGVGILALAAADVWRHRDAKSYLLAFWVIGTFLFTAFCNWVVNGRSILPMTPAVAILLVRRLEFVRSNSGKKWTPGTITALALGAVLAFMVVQSDFQTAVAVKQGARVAADKYGHGTGTLWFRAHWGFQYYLDIFGGKISDNTHMMFRSDDYLVIPFNNTNNQPPNQPPAQLVEQLEIYGPRWVSTLNKQVGAGFYASVLGPLPFAFGRVPPEWVFIYLMGPANPPPPAGK